MRKQFEEKSYFDRALKNVDEDILWNQKRKNKLQNKILLNMDKVDNKTRIFNRFKYASSVGILIVILFIGYNYFSQDVTYTNGKVPMEHENNQIENKFVVDKEGENNKENTIFPGVETTMVTREELAEKINLHLPEYIPEKTTPQYIMREYPDGFVNAEVKYIELPNLFIRFDQSEIRDSNDAIQKVKQKMYKNEELEEFEIKGYPSFLHLEGDSSYYSSLHIVTDRYFYTLTTHGVDKEEIIKIANSIDLPEL